MYRCIGVALSTSSAPLFPIGARRRQRLRRQVDARRPHSDPPGEGRDWLCAVRVRHRGQHLPIRRHGRTLLRLGARR